LLGSAAKTPPCDSRTAKVFPTLLLFTFNPSFSASSATALEVFSEITAVPSLRPSPQSASIVSIESGTTFPSASTITSLSASPS